jgi:hypothetical protein
MTSSENTDPGRIRSATDVVYGIRMTLPPDDAFVNILGSDATMYRWYASEQARDQALADLRREHLFSRSGDRPTLRYEPVERPTPTEYTRRSNTPAGS